jgi:polyisoprenoid-binding protein YceI
MRTGNVIDIPGYAAGTWVIDPVHSDVGFSARYMVVSKVRGRFRHVSGQVTTSLDPEDVTVKATIDLTSIDTGNEQRDTHLQSPDFLDAARNQTMEYLGQRLRRAGDTWMLDGKLSLNGTTRALPLWVESHGFGRDNSEALVAGFSARGQISLRDFGIPFAASLPGGGAVVGDKVEIHLEVRLIASPGDHEA